MFFFIIFIKIVYFSSFGHFLPDPPGGPGGCGSGFCALRNVFQRKFFIIFLIIFFIKMYISAYFDPPATIRTCPGSSGHIFLYI